MKAPLASPTFTGTATANKMNITTDLTCGTLTCESLYGGVIAQLKTNLFASPVLTGAATAVGLSVSGDLLIGATNVLTSLNSKMATSDVSSALALKAPLANPTFTGTLTAPLIRTGRITAAAGVREGGVLAWTGIIAMNTSGQEIFYTDNTRNVNFRGNVLIDGICQPGSIDCINGASVGGALTTTGDITCSGTLHIDTIVPRVATEITIAGNCVVDGDLIVDTIRSSLSDHIQIDDNFSVGGNLFTTGNLDVDGVITCGDIKGRNRPFFGLYINAAGTIVANVGQVQTGITVVIASSNAYAITSTTPHPLGDNYLLMAMSRTTSQNSAFAMCSGYGTATTLNVWNRTAANTIIMSPFFVYSVP